MKVLVTAATATGVPHVGVVPDTEQMAIVGVVPFSYVTSICELSRVAAEVKVLLTEAIETGTSHVGVVPDTEQIATVGLLLLVVSSYATPICELSNIETDVVRLPTEAIETGVPHVGVVPDTEQMTTVGWLVLVVSSYATATCELSRATADVYWLATEARDTGVPHVGVVPDTEQIAMVGWLLLLVS